MSTDVQLRLGPADAGLKLSREEFAAAIYEEPWKYERVGGRLAVMSPAGMGHQRPNNHVRDYLGQYRLNYPDVVQEVISESWIEIDEETDRIADIGVYLQSSAQRGDATDRAPELVYETVSETKKDRDRDYIEKRAEYQRAGVLEYVIVDRFEQAVLVIRWQDGSETERRLTAYDTYTSDLLPGLEIPLAKILQS